MDGGDPPASSMSFQHASYSLQETLPLPSAQLSAKNGARQTKSLPSGHSARGPGKNGIRGRPLCRVPCHLALGKGAPLPSAGHGKGITHGRLRGRTGPQLLPSATSMHNPTPCYNADENSSNLSLFQGDLERGSAGTNKKLTHEEWHTIMITLLLNLDEVIPYQKEYISEHWRGNRAPTEQEEDHLLRHGVPDFISWFYTKLALELCAGRYEKRGTTFALKIKKLKNPLEIISHASSLMKYWEGMHKELDADALHAGVDTMLKIAMKILSKTRRMEPQSLLQDANQEDGPVYHLMVHWRRGPVQDQGVWRKFMLVHLCVVVAVLNLLAIVL